MSVTITKAERATGERAEWNSDEYGLFHRWLVELSNGESTDVLRKPDAGSPEGKTVEQKNGRWKVAAQGGFNGGGGKDFKADPIKLRGENARSALHAAKDLVVAGKIDLKDCGEWTANFYNYIEKKAKVDG